MERNLSKNGLVNALALLVGGIALVVLAGYAKSLSAEVSAVFVGVGFLVSLTAWFQMRLESREEAERLELLELANSRSDSALFAESAAESFTAKRSREQFERWLVPIFTGALFIVEALAVWWFRERLLGQTQAMSAPDPQFAMAIGAGTGLVLFLVGKYSTRLAELENSRLLRPSASSVLLAALLCGLSAIIAACDWFGFPKYDQYAAWGLTGLLALTAVETLLSLILEIYRPRTRGKAPRVLYESRTIGTLSEGGGLFGTLAHALDYQFGFKVSETWFYDTLRQHAGELAFFWLVILAVSSSLVVIDPGQQGLLEHFGKPVENPILNPGFHVKWPWPIDTVERVDTTSLQSFTVGDEPDPELQRERTVIWTRRHFKAENYLLVASHDQGTGAGNAVEPSSTNGPTTGLTVPVNLLSAMIPVQYYIRDVQQWAYNHDNASDLLQRIAYREVTRYMASVDLPLVMSSGRLEAARDLEKAIQKKADDAKLGVQIVMVGLQDMHPPMGTKQISVAAAYEQVVGAIAEKETAILQAEAAKAETVPLAYAEATRLTNEAVAEAFWKREIASGTAARFTNQMAAYKISPKTYRQRAYLSTVAEALGPSRKLIVSATNTHDVILLNLEEKIRPDLTDITLESPDKKK
jgi:membrane protease subunit HflK